MAEVDKAFAKQVRARGFDVNVDKPVAPMFQPLRLREMELTNRTVVSPMLHVFGWTKAFPAISIWCITVRAPSAARA